MSVIFTSKSHPVLFFFVTLIFFCSFILYMYIILLTTILISPMIYKVYRHAVSAVQWRFLRSSCTPFLDVSAASASDIYYIIFYMYNLYRSYCYGGWVSGGAGGTAQTTMIVAFPCLYRYLYLYNNTLWRPELNRCARNFNKTRYCVRCARFMHPPPLLLMLQHAQAANRGTQLSICILYIYIYTV